MTTYLRIAVASISLSALSVSVADSQTVTERIRRTPGSDVWIGYFGEPVPMTLDAMTAAADIVAEAKLSFVRAFIDATDSIVLTEYRILPSRFLKGSVTSGASTPGQPVPFLLRKFGGEVIRDGIKVTGEDMRTPALKVGPTYLLFLRRSRTDEGVFTIYNVGVFIVDGDEVLATSDQNRTFFPDMPRNYSALAARVSSAVRAQ